MTILGIIKVSANEWEKIRIQEQLLDFFSFVPKMNHCYYIKIFGTIWLCLVE